MRETSTAAHEVSVSVVVPALNEEHHLGNLLSDPERQKRGPGEVIVIDAGSRDGTIAVAGSFAGVKVLQGERPVARGRNLGSRSASGDVVIYLDADARLPETFIERFIAAFSSRDLDLACPLYAAPDSTPAVRAFHRVFNLAMKVF